jgi:5-methyltetrahydropteroyltriglutamate--homocysteine methyltransferase
MILMFPLYSKMASHIVGYPRMGPKRELKFALESFWDKKSGAEDLEKVATDLRASIWKQMSEAGIKYIPSNTFSYYDQVLDTTAMLGAVPDRYSWTGGEIGHDTYFSMARGNAIVPAMEMTKWFDTNYHFIVPELAPETKFSYASHKAVSEYKEAKALGVDTVPVLVGPVSYLLLSKAAKGVEKSFSPLSLLPGILPIYKEVVAELKAAGAIWIQFDEPTLVKDLAAHELAAFSSAYAELEPTLSGLNVLVETYFADVPAESYKTLTSLSGVTAYGFDLVRGTKTLDLVKSAGFPSGKYLFAGVVDGRNIWADDLAASLSTLQSLETVVGKDKLVVSTSCSLMHTAVDLVNETKLDSEIKSWLAFAAQKVVEVDALAKALAGQKDEAYFAANAAAQASRRSSPRVNNEEVQKAAAALKGSDHRRATTVSSRLDAQQKKLNLPVLPTTTIGSFPQTVELRRVRREYKAKKVTEEEYVKAIEEEIRKVVKIQEDLDIDVLVHGEPERNDMVEYFGEQLSGFAFTANGWVQSYGSRCVKPPIIYGDVSRPKAMTVFWSKMAQDMTPRPMKGMLTGPVTILNWSFVRNDQPRFETCYQIALAIKKEVEDLEAAGIQVIQIDEAALREGLPLRKSEHAFYLDWAVHSFRITNCGVQDTTQIHTHMCYSNFNDIILSIINMDADVITIENSRSDEKLLSVFREGVTYGAGIGPGVYDIHSPRIPSTEEIADRVNKMLAVLDTNILWVNPDCGLKTRKYAEVMPALTAMVNAAKLIRTQLASTK